MLDDAVKQRQAEGGAEGVRVLDVAQVLEQSLTGGPPASASGGAAGPGGAAASGGASRNASGGSQ
jgi:hypothetical protein